jgi:hypothetical protein
VTQWVLFVTVFASVWSMGCTASWLASRTPARKCALGLARCATLGLVAVTLFSATGVDAASITTKPPVATRDRSELRHEMSLTKDHYVCHPYELRVTRKDSPLMATVRGSAEKPGRALQAAALLRIKRIALATQDVSGLAPPCIDHEHPRRRARP